MVNIDTFLTRLYVMVDDFCKAQLPPGASPRACCIAKPSGGANAGNLRPMASLWQRAGFYRYVQGHLRAAFPNLPARGQFNRLLRHQHAAVAYFRHLVHQRRAQHCVFEALDAMGVPTRDAKRRGPSWLPGRADIGWSNRLGWYEGFHLLLAVNPEGIMTGYGFGSASSKDQVLAETFFALRTRRTDTACPA